MVWVELNFQNGLNNLKRNKMTAVDFLVKELPMVYWEDPYYLDLLEQAKEMEKQQIIDAYLIGDTDAGIYSATKKNAEQYYNETFNKQKL